MPSTTKFANKQSSFLTNLLRRTSYPQPPHIFKRSDQHRRRRMTAAWQLLALLIAGSSSLDKSFHEWCGLVGISSPGAYLETSQRSVAGRGVFSISDIQKGDTVISVPASRVLFDGNAAQFFPEVTKKIRKGRKEYKRTNSRWNRPFRALRESFGKQPKHGLMEFINNDDLWQAELTLYAAAAIQYDHAWAPWILQWKRDDPVHDLFTRGVSYKDHDEISACCDKLSKMYPQCPANKLWAAVDLRLRRYQCLKDLYNLPPDAAGLYSVLCSRAVEVFPGITAVLPMHDMINHSCDPNLALDFDGDYFHLVAKRDIEADDELFLRYTEKNLETDWDENAAVWALVQWGIPHNPPSQHQNAQERVATLSPINV